MTMRSTDRELVPERPKTLFPLIRQVSTRLTPILVRLPVTANQVTGLSLIVGLIACWYFLQEGWRSSLAGAALLVLHYVLDHCDGEIARLKGQSSDFGKHFDSLVDCVVNAGFFAALGIGVARETGVDFWGWLGLSAAAGATINYAITLAPDRRFRQSKAATEGLAIANRNDDTVLPETLAEHLLFAFRELARADFCFIVLGLALFDWVWLLLPAGAVGAHLYWLGQFVGNASRFRA